MPKFKFKSSGIQVEDPTLTTTRTTAPVGIKTPLRPGAGRSGIFEMNYTVESQIGDNLRNLIMTNHGERLGNFSYGANLIPLTFEMSSGEEFESQAMQRIMAAVSTFMPYIELSSFSSDFSGNSPITTIPGTDAGIKGGGITLVNIKVEYSIPSIGLGSRALQITLTAVG
jgi:phage baseplate assembly protein W